MRKPFLAIFAVLLFSMAVGAEIVPDGLVGHWKLDETVGVVAADSAGSNNGTLVNGPVWTEGRFDGALDFDGVNDYVTIPDNDAFTPSNAITISFWLYNSGGVDMGIYKWASCASSRSYYALVANNSSKVSFSVYASTNSADNILSLSAVSLNEWHHILVTFESGIAKIYIDGALDNSKAMSVSTIMNDTNPLMIGGHWNYCVPSGLYQRANGMFDEVRIYNRALNADEVAQLYAMEQPEIIGLEIDGLDEIAEDSRQQYKATAICEDNSTRDVTGKVKWFADNCDFAGIDANGLFWADKVLYMKSSCTIYANLATDNNDVITAKKTISILPMCTSGSALEFDGVDDFVMIPPSTSLDITGSLTILAWVKNSSDDAGIVFWRGDLRYGTDPYMLYMDASKMYSRVDAGSGVSMFRAGSNIAVDNQWNFWAGVCDKQQGKLYLYKNGTLEKTVTIDKNIEYTTLTMWNMIGAADIGRLFNFKGLIDEIAIFNCALTAETIQYNMYHRLVGNESGLVGYWDFDEGQGQIAHDKSGKGNDGQLGGSVEVQISDPNWAMPGAPAICTRPALAKRNIHLAKEIKKDIVEDLDYALKAELAADSILLDVQRDKESKNVWAELNIIKAKSQIVFAIIQERIAKSKIIASIHNLADALEALTPAEEPSVKSDNPKK